LHNARAGLATAHTSMENRWTLPIGRFTDAGRRALGADASGANLLRDTSVDFDQIDFLRVTMNGYEPTREAAMAAFAKSWRRECRLLGAFRTCVGDRLRRLPTPLTHSRLDRVRLWWSNSRHELIVL
jgi:hypothetical protein